MSSGAAEVIGELLKIPVAREITIAVLWFLSMQFAISERAWDLLCLATVFGVVVLGLVWWKHHRAKKSEGGGKLLFVLLMMFIALPLLLIAWRRQKNQEATRG